MPARSRLALLCLSASTIMAAPSLGSEPSLTFFGWSDQHVQVDGDAKHLVPAIDAMNRLPGTDYPPQIGGKVSKPAFVFGCGDITEWPTHAAMKAYDDLLTRRLKYPAHDVIGNHDEGGKSPSETIKKWLIGRHGALTYSFSSGGVRFIALYSRYDESLDSPAQPLTPKSLQRLAAELKKSPPDTPTIIATHLCYDAMTNRDALIDVLKPYNVLMILGGHYHKAKVDRYRGLVFVQLPSPAPGTPSEVTVVRITPERVVAVPYDYETNSWSTDKRKMLDMPLPERREDAGVTPGAGEAQSPSGYGRSDRSKSEARNSKQIQMTK